MSQGPSGFARAMDLELHRVAFDGDCQRAKELLGRLQPTPQQLQSQLDIHGNTALHVAAMRGHADVVQALLDAGMPATAKNSSGFIALHDAVQGGHSAVARLLADADVAQHKAKARAQQRALIDKLAQLPDCTLQLKWELHSHVPGVGLLLRKYAPHDVYTVWKQGSRLRVDGTLMGIAQDEEDGTPPSLLPEWKRGHFSLLYDGTGEKATIYFVDHNKKDYVDMKALHKQISPDMSLGVHSDLMQLQMAAAASHGVVEKHATKTSDVRFEPVRGWVTKHLTEDVDGWKAKVYEVSAAMAKHKRFRLPWSLPSEATWEEYLAAPTPQVVTLEIPTHPFSSATFSSSKAEADELVCSAREAAVAAAARIRKRYPLASTCTAGPTTESSDHTTGASTQQEGPQGDSALQCVQGVQGDAATSLQGIGIPGAEADGEGVTHPANSAGKQAAEAVPPGHNEAGGSESSTPVYPHDHPGTLTAGLGELQDSTPGYGTGRGGDDAVSARSADSGALETGVKVQRQETFASAQSSTPVAPEPVPDDARSVRGAAADCPAGSAGSDTAEGFQGQATADGTAGLPDTQRSSSASSGTEEVALPPHKFKPAKRVTGRCWMAEGFPMALHDLLPLLEAISVANKYLSKVSSFLVKYGDRGEFPVKIHVPLVYSLYFVLSVKKAKLLVPPPTQVASSSSSSAAGRVVSRLFFSLKTGGGATAPLQKVGTALPEDFFLLPAGYEQVDPSVHHALRAVV